VTFLGALCMTHMHISMHMYFHMYILYMHTCARGCLYGREFMSCVFVSTCVVRVCVCVLCVQVRMRLCECVADEGICTIVFLLYIPSVADAYV